LVLADLPDRSIRLDMTAGHLPDGPVGSRGFSTAKAKEVQRGRVAMKTMPYPVRLPKHLLELADLRAEDQQVDRSTALRQLLYVGATGYVLELLHKGRISLSKAAELLDCSTLAIVQKSQERNLVMGATLEQYGRAKARTRSKR
jgi:hypothetical protein